MKKPIDQNSLSLEDQYQLFLQRMNLKEANMHPMQKKQVKQAFFGACGQLLILFRDVIGNIEPEEEAVDAMEGLKKEVMEYWNKETDRLN